MRPLTSRRGAVAAALALAPVLALGACSGSPDADAPAREAHGSAVSAQRCAQNEAAGPVTYVTGYQFQASASILDPVAAEALGYFDAVCLDVRLQPGTGETAQNAQLVAAGTAQLSSIAGNSDVLVNVANGVDVQAVAQFGHVPVATLLTRPDVTDLEQLQGKVLGQKGALPVDVDGMLRAAGVDVAAIDQVVVGYDPTVLVRGQVDALTGYKSNEPLTLAAAGEQVREWNPEDFGVPGSMATTVVNPAFLAAHRGAVEDFLRAQLRAYAHCEQQAEECVDLAADLAEVGYDTEHNVQVWRTETRLVDDSLPAGQVLGQLTAPDVRTEGDFLVRMGRIGAVPDLDRLVVGDLVPSLYADGRLVWPVP